MLSKRFFVLSVAFSVFLMFSLCGCGEPTSGIAKIPPAQKKPVSKGAKPAAETPAEQQVSKQTTQPGAELAYKFKPGDTVTYRLTTEATQQVKWEGSVPDKSVFQNEQNVKKTEMIFAQQIQDVHQNGTATAKITIKELKYSNVVKSRTVTEFDSLKAKSGDIASNLIGQSYTISIAPDGKVEVIDVSTVLSAVSGGSRRSRECRALLRPSAIKKRHAFLRLPAADENPLQPTEQWSNENVFSFGLMGSHPYERVYTLQDLQQNGGAGVAVVTMEGIPSVELSEETSAMQLSWSVEMFDAEETYEGLLKMVLGTGEVEKYSEKLDIDWVAILPKDKKQMTEPAVLKMGATRRYSLEKID